MKKILAIITLTVLIGGTIGTGIAMAQDEKLNECCLLKNAVKIGEGTENTFAINDVVGPVNGVCNIDVNSDGTINDSDKITRETKDWGMVCTLNSVYTVTNWVFYIMTIVAVLMIVFGGFTYITAAGDPTKAGKGKGILMFAIIGLAIALIAKLIPSLVRFIIGT
ncbi:MAG: pilin [Candidatus Pacebacteria bacterium]|nr:pilin [Candidatus Paceibacterota bacterium]